MTNNTHRPASLLLRVTVLVGVAISVCLAALGWVVLRSVEIHFAEQDADELRVVAAAVNNTLKRYGDDNDRLSRALPSAISGHHGVYFEVNDETGKQLYASPGVNLSSVSDIAEPIEHIERNNLVRWSESEEVYRGNIVRQTVSTTSGLRTFTVTVASAMSFHLDFLSRFEKTLWAIIAAVGVLTILAAWLAVHWGHAPLRKISEEIRGIRSDQLDVRLDSRTVPTELLKLVTSFNDMLDRIEDVFQRLSNFSADIAHELRTPITNLTTQTQVSLSKARTVEEYREVLYSNLEEYERLTKMINNMLWLAKTENGVLKPEFGPIQLKDEVTTLFDYFEAWAEEHGVLLKLEGSCPPINGGKTMLRRALSNLLTNAIRHADRNSNVVVHLQRDDDKVVIDVKNRGDEIPSELLPKIFHRFYRADPSRQRNADGDGVGLGLAIVESIVKAHGGKISVASENRITTFRIVLPTRCALSG